MIELTEQTFADKFMNAAGELENKTGRVALIDFYATWCKPCIILGITLKEMEEKTPDIDFYKIDVDENQGLASNFKIQSIPTILIIHQNMKKGQGVFGMAGAHTEKQINEFINDKIKND